MNSRIYNRLLFALILFVTLLSPIQTKNVHANERINFSYIYSVSKNDYVKHVDQANNTINIIAPNYFDLSKHGDLIITENFDAAFIKEMKKRNIKVVPFLSNHWDKEAGINALKNKDTLTTKIVEQILKHNLDGINIDIEGLSHSERDAFSEFVKTLKSKMPADKELSLAVAANPKGSKTGWHGSYDYNKLADHADYLIIMAYDESYRGGKPGPVASIEFVEKSIQYAIDEGVSADKLVLGIPFYGRIWKLEDIETNSGVVGDGIWMNKTFSFIENYRGTTELVEKKGSLVARVTITENDPPYQLFSWKPAFTPGHYEVWFDNEQTIQKKLELVNKYNLKGTANWSLGQEAPTIWASYKTWLNPTLTVSTPAKSSNNPIPVSNSISVVVNGETLIFDQEPYIYAGKTLVPLRGVFEKLEATVDWDQTKKEVTAIKGDTTVWLKANSLQAKINDIPTEIDVPVQIKEGRTMIPLRFIGEAFGANVQWENTTKQVFIEF
ncbi:stalk domain-containing protein [Calidifontibacillus oryziterrae]|uniref:stalk domain-containing protein n=1 Tax=Calidifontibacillus oryziterrae TaxID=1191699 RepID=UPI000314C343|nr:glycosyl hydrolase family 18 protein [Calidifontibacillus oryziterrae]